MPVCKETQKTVHQSLLTQAYGSCTLIWSQGHWQITAAYMVYNKTASFITYITQAQTLR